MTLPTTLFSGALLGALAGTYLCAGAGAGFPPPFNTERQTNGPMAAAESVRTSAVPPGFRLAIVASEPEVQQPIAMATDPRGRLWVAENYTYAEAAVGFHPGLRDRIVVFDGQGVDGHFARRTVFWDHAERLTSIEVGLGGVWALCMPNLLFIPDADGDGVPDGPPQVVLDGFEFQAARHNVANGLRWGPDGWLYGRQGILGHSKVGAPGTPEADRVPLNAGIWRYHPTRKTFEVVAQGTTNPWGMDWDAHGEAFFINTVIGHLWHLIPGAHYRRMFGDDADPHIYELIDQHADHVHWASGEAWTDVRKKLTDSTSAAGGGHAHAGVLIYQGGQWPAEWKGRFLTLNLHGKRINVDRLERTGSGYAGRHLPDMLQFGDPWFRGLDLIAAPDGGVFASDWSDTGECHEQDGVHRTSGRIYHLAHGSSGPVPAKDISRLPLLALAELQRSANDWESRQARRVLADRYQRGESLEAARSALERLATRDHSEVIRLRALWALHVSGGVPAPVLQSRFAGTEHERVWALRLWEDSTHNPGSNWHLSLNDPVGRRLPAMALAERSALVRLGLASLLQRLPLADRRAVAAGLLARGEDSADHNLPLMIWYGIEPALVTDSGFAELVARARIPKIQQFAARRYTEELGRTTDPISILLRSMVRRSDPVGCEAVLNGMLDGLAARRKVMAPGAWSEVRPALERGASPAVLHRIQLLRALFGEAEALEHMRVLALDGTAVPGLRKEALATLIEVRATGLRELCEQCVEDPGLTAVAARGLALFDAPGIADHLVALWPRLAAADRPPVLNALLSRPGWAGKVLDAVGKGIISRVEFGRVQARQVRGFRDPALDRALETVWGVLQEPDERSRNEVMETWRARLDPARHPGGDSSRGREVFRSTCGACHKLYGSGGSLGPDLTGSGRRNLDYLLENILYPSEVVATEYRQTTVDLKDGRVLSGLIRGRSPRAITLDMVGETLTLPRDEIDREQLSALSLMPEGLLEGLGEGQRLDLFAYLMSSSPPPRATHPPR